MSLGEFAQWLNVASADGHISDEEVIALLEKARLLHVDEASAKLLIEQKRQQFILNQGTCPVCEHPLGEATLTMLCPNCKADLTAVRAKYTAGGGLQVYVQQVEDSIAALSSIHIPSKVSAKSFDHGAFAAAVSNAEKSVSHLQTLYGASNEVATTCLSYRSRIEASRASYNKAVNRARYGWIIPVVGLALLFGAAITFYLISSSTSTQQRSSMVAEFNRLINQKEFDQAERLYETMRAQKIPEALAEKTFTRDGASSSIPEYETWIMNGRFKKWSEPLLGKIDSSINARRYDSAYAVLKVLQSEFRSYPTTNSEQGLYGEECTSKIIDEIIEVVENQMFDNELQNGTFEDAMRVLSRVSSSERRRTLLEHAQSYLTETNRLDEARRIKEMLLE